MRFHVVLRYVAFSLILNAIFLAISTLISALNSFDSAFMPLLYSTLITILFAVFPLIFVPPIKDITDKEGLMIVVLSWIVACFIGALPYTLFGDPFTFVDAIFESVSGFTTTGSTILTNIEILPSGLLFWRAATHWIGGIGIIIFILAVLPYFGNTDAILFRSEVSSLVRESFQLRAKKAIRILVGVYLGLTLLETLTLVVLGMNIFDAVTHSFSTIATGGFSNKNASVAYYNSPAIESAIIVFMVLSGIHFALLFALITGNVKAFLQSSVVKFYFLALSVGIIFSSVNVYGDVYNNWYDSIRYAAFNIISVGTSTGFATTNTAIWPSISKLILIYFALQCACSGSTSGGIKVDRVVIFTKSFLRRIKKMMYPNAVIVLRVSKKTLTEEKIANSVLFIATYLIVVFVSTFLLAWLGVNLLEAFTGTIACIGNVGPGLGAVGSTGNFSGIPDLGKLLLALVMLLGRLEIFAFFVFLSPGQWKKSKSY